MKKQLSLTKLFVLDKLWWNYRILRVMANVSPNNHLYAIHSQICSNSILISNKSPNQSKQAKVRPLTTNLNWSNMFNKSLASPKTLSHSLWMKRKNGPKPISITTSTILLLTMNNCSIHCLITWLLTMAISRCIKMILQISIFILKNAIILKKVTVRNMGLVLSKIVREKVFRELMIIALNLDCLWNPRLRDKRIMVLKLIMGIINNQTMWLKKKNIIKILL